MRLRMESRQQSFRDDTEMRSTKDSAQKTSETRVDARKSPTDRRSDGRNAAANANLGGGEKSLGKIGQDNERPGTAPRIGSAPQPRDSAADLEEKMRGTFVDFVSAIDTEQPNLLAFGLVTVVAAAVHEIRDVIETNSHPDVTWPTFAATIHEPIMMNWETQSVEHLRITPDELRRAKANGVSPTLHRSFIDGLGHAVVSELFFQLTSGSAWITSNGQTSLGCLDGDLRERIEAEIHRLPIDQQQAAYDRLAAPKCLGIPPNPDGEFAATSTAREIPTGTPEGSILVNEINRWFTFDVSDGDDNSRLLLNLSFMIEPAIIDFDERKASYPLTFSMWFTKRANDETEGLVLADAPNNWSAIKRAGFWHALEERLRSVAQRLWRVVVTMTVETNFEDAGQIEGRLGRIADVQKSALRDEGRIAEFAVRRDSELHHQKKSAAKASVAREPGDEKRHPLESLIRVNRADGDFANVVLCALFDSSEHMLTGTEIRQREFTRSRDSDTAVRGAWNAIMKTFPQARPWIYQRKAKRGRDAVIGIRDPAVAAK